MKKLAFISIMLLSTTLAFGQEAKSDIKSDVKPEKFDAKISGRAYLDGSLFFQEQTKIGNGATISDIRLGVSGKYKQFSAKVDVGFAKKAVSLKDVYIQYNFKDNSYFRAGHFAEPFGIDYMESSGGIRFINAGCVTEAFAPGRKLGVEYIGWNKNFWYGGGFFGDSRFDSRQNLQGNDGFAFTGRGVFNPIKTNGNILHIGAAISLRTPDAVDKGKPDERVVSYGANLGSMVNSEKFVNATIGNVNNSLKIAGEFIGAIGKVSLQSEYFYVQANRKEGFKNYKAWGAYGQIGFIAIGDSYAYSSQWGRIDLPKPGTLELAIRYSHLDLNDQNAEILGGKQQQLTVGCNYYWKSFIRLRLNYNLAHMDEHAVGGKQNFSFLSARCQFFF